MRTLDGINRTWMRMNRNRYNIGRMEKYPDAEGPFLVVFTDRPMPPGEEGKIGVTAIVGPLDDAESLEDACAYADAPGDVKFLLDEINRLKAILMLEGLVW